MKTGWEFSLEKRKLQEAAFQYFKVAYKKSEEDFWQRHVLIGQGGMDLRWKIVVLD